MRIKQIEGTNDFMIVTDHQEEFDEMLKKLNALPATEPTAKETEKNGPNDQPDA